MATHKCQLGRLFLVKSELYIVTAKYSVPVAYHETGLFGRTLLLSNGVVQNLAGLKRFLSRNNASE